MRPRRLARAVKKLGPGAVVVTGGHRGDATDVFFDGARLVEIEGERYADGAAHGSGCTHSSALAAHLALGLDPLEATRRAKSIASEAIAYEASRTGRRRGAGRRAGEAARGGRRGLAHDRSVGRGGTRQPGPGRPRPAQCPGRTDRVA